MAISAHDTPETLPVLANTLRKDFTALGKQTKIDICGDRLHDNAKRRVKQRTPFLRSDKIQTLSRVTEKRLIHGSSYPLALNIYRANSDEFKTPKRNKKIKKSVHTLPNDPGPMPQACTVSDMNESEYYNREDESAQSKLRRKVQSRKNRTRRRDYEYYDRDAQHCSDLERSSTEIIKNFGGDGKRFVKSKDLHVKTKNDHTSQDMWTVLRNINKFQFKPSPRMSDDSLGLMPKKRSTFAKKHTNLSNGRRLIETCRTAEVSYVANFEFDNDLPQICVTPSISGDRITVIEQNSIEPKYDPYHNISKVVKPRSPLTIRERYSNRNNLRPTNFKAVAVREYNKYVPFNKYLPEIKNINTKYRCSSTKLSIDSSNGLRTKDNSRVIVSSGKLTMDYAHLIDKEEQLGTNTMLTQKSRQVTLMPKLTKAEIKRRLTHLKFPLVVLGKDQISSSMEIFDYDPPQFDGLDKHIWPFMVDWTNNGTHLIDKVTNNLRKMSLEVHKKPNNSSVQLAGNKKSEKRFPPQSENSACPLTPKKSKPMRHFRDKMLRFLYKNPSPSNSEENKDIKYAKAEKVDACTEPIIEDLGEPHKQKKILKSFEKNLNSFENKPKGVFILSDSKKPKEILNLLEKQTKNMFMSNRQRYPGRVEYMNGSRSDHWNFIDNIIKKIRSGVYYTNDENILNDKSGEVDFIENLMNTSIDDRISCESNDGAIQSNEKCSKNDFSRPSDALTVINDNDAYHHSISEVVDTMDVKIPGFDDDVDILRELEVSSLTFNKIAIKHRLTNVIVQFDITVPSKSYDFVLDVNSSSSFVPLTVTDNNTKVFKCNTKIVNAILPAELCNLIPTLMREFIDSKAHLTLFPAPSPAIQRHDCACATSDLDLHSIYTVNPCNILGLYDIPKRMSFDIMSPVLKTALHGKFAIKIFTPCVCCTHQKFDIYHTPSMADVTIFLPALSSPIPIFLCIVNPLDFRMPKANSETQNQSSDCRALQVYQQNNYSLNDLAHPKLMQAMRKFYTFNLTFSMPPYLNTLIVKSDMLLTLIEGLEGTIATTLRNMHAESISSRFLSMKINEIKKKVPEMEITLKKVPQMGNTLVAPDKVITEVLPVKAKQSKIAFSLLGSNLISGKPDIVFDFFNKTGKKDQKYRKYRYIRLYKKCKSTTNLSGERSCTPLNKIINLDEFFQALGCAKTMSCIFDGNNGKKIMAAIEELKSWISDLTPRQAMLVLLLTNKKDTPNLIRFRPVLLQGIAVNRITRAIELNMEIEVIETEKVGLTKEYEGISYVPASIENQDSLLEELCWIAKNTASDYHKTFDESSAKLLKSLIQKRKKLNPSYLRVVARYVGLGLLKK